MQENELLFPEDNEDSVHQLGKLRKKMICYDLHKYIVQRFTFERTNNQVQRAVTWFSSKKLKYKKVSEQHFISTEANLGMQMVSYTPCVENVCRNSGQVLSAPTILKIARERLQAVNGRRRAKGSLRSQMSKKSFYSNCYHLSFM